MQRTQAAAAQEAARARITRACAAVQRQQCLCKRQASSLQAAALCCVMRTSPSRPLLFGRAARSWRLPCPRPPCWAQRRGGRKSRRPCSSTAAGSAEHKVASFECRMQLASQRYDRLVGWPHQRSRAAAASSRNANASAATDVCLAGARPLRSQLALASASAGSATSTVVTADAPAAPA